jgi:hypothetical protein
MGRSLLVEVEAENRGAPDRTYLGSGPDSRRAAVHVVHDLPHLVVESLFGLDDGLWAELTRGAHTQSNLAAGARDRHRRKQGRIVSGAAAGVALDDWLSEGHRRAKMLTNAVTNPSGDGHDTLRGVRERVAHSGDPAMINVLAGINDETIAAAIKGVRHLHRRWLDLPPGASLRRASPLPVSEIER